VDEVCGCLGISPQDERLDRAFAALHPYASATARTAYALASVVLHARRDRGAGLAGFDEAVVEVLARHGPLPLADLADRARTALGCGALAEWPEFSPEQRLRRLGPAVARDDGLYELPPHPLPVSRDKTLRRLWTMVGVLEQLGPSHFSTICAEANARLPAEYRLDERDTHAWLSRYIDHFAWAGKGYYGLIAQGVGQGHGPAPPRPEEPGRVRLRRGIGDEVARLLHEEGPQPLDIIRTHVHARFVVHDSSIDAAILQYGKARFVVRDDGQVALRTGDEAAPAEAPRQVRLMEDELGPLTERAVELVYALRRDAATGFARLDEQALYKHAVVAALLNCSDALAALERAPAHHQIPQRAWAALASGASQATGLGADAGG
jgi:hypothetical protein